MNQTSMKELGNKLRALRGEYSVESMSEKTGISRETIRKLENGQKISIKSLIRIARSVCAKPEDQDELLCTWLRAVAGVYSKRLRIEPAGKRSRLAVVGEDLTERMEALFASLSTKEQRQLIAAVQRTEVLRAIPHLNRLYDEVRSSLPPTEQQSLAS